MNHEKTPHPGKVTFGDFRRLAPISTDYGFDRGTPIDRYYIEEKFLKLHEHGIYGHVLEIAENKYICKFGKDRVTKADVLHAREGNPNATIVGDLSDANHIQSDTFDCVIFTQTLFLIYDYKAALQTLYRVLKPGGTLLATFPGISQMVSSNEKDPWDDYWRFTSTSARRIFEEIFVAENVTVSSYGNILVVISFLHGLAYEELNLDELDYFDPAYELIISVKAVKPK